jgi:RimJ/RimL family protein N-acetyltransferase
MDVLGVDAYDVGRFKAGVPLECKLATISDMQMLFDNWPDSKEEYDRHYEVYYRWGFKRCFLFYRGDTGEVVHFKFLLTLDDLAKIQQFLPRQKYRGLDNKSCASIDWEYTFEKYRQLGVGTEATDSIVKFCRDHGIRKLYGRRSMTNTPSMRFGDKVGWVPHGIVYHIKFLNQRKHSGLHIVKRLRKSASIS